MLSGLYGLGELEGRRKGWAHSMLSLVCLRALDRHCPSLSFCFSG